MFVRIFLTAFLYCVSCQSYSQSQLFLVGGSWKTCGSMSGSSCIEGTKWPDNAKSENAYSVTPAKVAQIKQLPIWQKSEQQLKGALLNVLQNFHQIHKTQPFGRHKFHAQLKNLEVTFNSKTINARTLFNDLPDHLYYPIHDILETANQSPTGSFRKEYANIGNTKYASSQAIYARFFDAVKRVTPDEQQPVILISTASGYDVFGAVDYYLSIFSQLGAEAKWLPVEATLGKLADENADLKTDTHKNAISERCQHIETERAKYVSVYNRQNVYSYLAKIQQEYCANPEKLVTLAAQANGIFFNGGDQSLTWQAFVKPDNSDRPWLAALRKKYNEGKLVISGTSAGTAVQSGLPLTATAGPKKKETLKAPMITGGTSDGAMISGSQDKFPWIERTDPEANIRPVTYHSFGGLKFFPYGPLDTHFSERGRQLRLAKLVVDSDAKFGFGVDETTALVTTPIDNNNAEFEVVGQNGVYIVEQQETSVRGTNEISFLSHYLISGQKFKLNNDKLIFEELEFSPFNGKTEKIVTDKDLTQKSEYRDLVESQLNIGAKLATSIFENNQKTFSISIELNNDSGISKLKSRDGLSGYINAVVKSTIL